MEDYKLKDLRASHTLNCRRFEKYFSFSFSLYLFLQLERSSCSCPFELCLASVVKWKMCDLKKSKNTKINEYVPFPIFKKGGLPSVLWKRLVI